MNLYQAPRPPDRPVDLSPEGAQTSARARQGRRSTNRNNLGIGICLRQAALAVLLALIPTLLPFTSSPVQASSDRLYQGQALYGGGALTSANGRYSLTMQANGDLVLSTHGQRLWASNTAGNSYAHLVLQYDDNLVIYSNIFNRPLWSTNTQQAFPGWNYSFIVQSDSNLVVYDGRWSPKWNSDTWRSTGTTRSGNPFAYGQCTWGAEDSFHAYTGSSINESRNAVFWATDARGWRVVSTPAPFSIAVVPAGAGPPWVTDARGHVFWVLAVRPGQVLAHQMNYWHWPYWAPDMWMNTVPGMQYILAP